MTAQLDKAQLVLSDLAAGGESEQRLHDRGAESPAQNWPAQLRRRAPRTGSPPWPSPGKQQLDSARTEVVAAQQQAEIRTDVAQAGGAPALIAQAGTALTTASK